MTPFATSSARVIPPKTFKNTTLTLELEITILRALAIFSEDAPPPISKNVAAFPHKVLTYPYR